MSDDRFTTLVEKTKRQGEGADTVSLTPSPEAAAEAGPDPFSVLSADRMQKVMCEFRLRGGNAVALAYSYLVKAEFDPSNGIDLDFSSHQVRLTGNNLAPVFAAVVSQRVAVVTEVDDLHAEAEFGPDATVVTGIAVTKVE
jgi:hypothetical protein